MAYTKLQSHVPMQLLLKGDSGTGKTFKAMQFPRPCLINIENNIRGLRLLPEDVKKHLDENNLIYNPTVKNGKPIPPKDIFPEILKAIESASANPNVDTIVVDSFTALAEYLQSYIIKSDNPAVQLSQPNYGAFTRYCNTFGTQVLTNPELGKNIIIIAHERDITDKDGNFLKRVLATPTVIKETFPRFFSDVWRCYTKITSKGAVEYRVRTKPAVDASCKCSFDIPQDFIWDEEKDNVLAQVSTVSNPHS